MEVLDFLRLFLWLIFLLSSLAVCCFIYQYIESYIYRLPPGPITGLPFFGYVPFADKEPHKKFQELSKKYGPLVSLSLGSYRAVIVCEYEYAKELLSHPATFGRPEVFFSFLPYNAGFAGMNGDEWQEQRKFCIRTMRSLGIRKGPWEQIIQEGVAEFVEYLLKWKDKSIDVNGPLLRSGVRSNAALIIGRRLSGKETNSDVKVVEKAHHVVTEHTKMTNPAALMPWLVKYLARFNIAGYADKTKAIENFGNVFRREIEKHQNCEDNTDPQDFIGRYLEVLNKKNTADDNKYYSVENLIGNSAALFVGGSDTTSASISWLLVLMAENQKVQEKVQKEIDDVLSRDGPINWDDRKKLPFTMATIFEMERWASIVPFYAPRCVTETFEFRGYNIPKGVIIVGNTWAIHRDPKHWDNPDEFVPERFLQTNEKSGKDASKLNGFAAFSFGKRNCPGETVAIMTIFLYFTRIMQKFAISTPPGRRVNLNSQFSPIMYPSAQELCFIVR